MRQPERGPTFLAVRWEAERREQGKAVTFEATLCLRHRKEVSQIPGARGCGKVGESCDFCEGRGPRRA